MKIAEFAVNRPVAVVMRIAALVLLGAVCLTKLPVDLLPKISLPTVVVVTQWPNVAPEELETQITRPIEEAVSQVNGLYLVSSSTVQGVSQVRIQFNWGTDIGQAAVDTLQLVERAQRNFPVDPTLQTPTVFKIDPSQLPILIYAISGEKDPIKLRTEMDNIITPIIESANGVASAVATGGQQRNIIVDVDPIRLRAHHLVLTDIVRRIGEENINLPAGIGKQGKTEYTIRSLGWFSSVQQLAMMPAGTFNGQNVLLKDVAEVKDTHPELRIYTRMNHEDSVGLVISKQSGVNTISTAKGVFAKIDQVKKLYPNLKFNLAYDQSSFITDSVNDVMFNAILGGLMAVIILLFFLRNIRSTLVVGLSIPISIISTFALIYMCGFTLNTMSLGGLALATGLIVDDAVVVMENIFRHIERDKKSSREASISGTDEILSAVVASTWTVMVVFLPLLLIQGQAGQMYSQFALVVVFSLAVSLLDAATVVPMLCSKLIKGEAHAEELQVAEGHRTLLQRMFHKVGLWFEALDNAYHDKLKWALHHRYIVLLGAGAIVGLSLLLLPMVGTELMPQTDSGNFNVVIKLPIGTALSVTNDVMKKVENITLSNPNVETAFSSAGTTLSMRGTSTTLIPNQGALIVKLKEKRKQSTQAVITDLRKQFLNIPGVRPLLTPYDIVSQIITGGNQNVEVDIFGQDLDKLSQVSRDVLGRVKNIAGLENVDVNWQDALPEIQWKVDREKAAQMGVSFSSIANTISTATNGYLASYYQENGWQYPIQVQMPESARKTASQMEGLVVSPASPGGTTHEVLLSQVAQLVYGTGPSEITRLNRQRYIAITGTPMGRSAGDIQKDMGKAMADVTGQATWPAGYYWDWGVNQKQQADSFSGMWLAVLLAIGLIYMLLASQFESYIHPLTILFSVPLAVTGVILGLFLTNRSFGLTAFIGVLMLVGICVKNGILLVDYTNTLRGRGLKREEALLRAGPTRLRPILMTASAAILGMTPIALGLGKGSEVQSPMATAVIGGLATSTFLTLFVVPTVYSLLDDVAEYFKRRRGESSE